MSNIDQKIENTANKIEVVANEATSAMGATIEGAIGCLAGLFSD